MQPAGFPFSLVLRGIWQMLGRGEFSHTGLPGNAGLPAQRPARSAIPGSAGVLPAGKAPQRRYGAQSLQAAAKPENTDLPTKMKRRFSIHTQMPPVHPRLFLLMYAVSHSFRPTRDLFPISFSGSLPTIKPETKSKEVPGNVGREGSDRTNGEGMRKR